MRTQRKKGMNDIYTPTYPTKCCFCGAVIETLHDGHNPRPIAIEAYDLCCKNCNMEKVIPARYKKRLFAELPELLLEGLLDDVDLTNDEILDEIISLEVELSQIQVKLNNLSRILANRIKKGD